jgi:hypothetical protein
MNEPYTLVSIALLDDVNLLSPSSWNSIQIGQIIAAHISCEMCLFVCFKGLALVANPCLSCEM